MGCSRLSVGRRTQLHQQAEQQQTAPLQTIKHAISVEKTSMVPWAVYVENRTQVQVKLLKLEAYAHTYGISRMPPGRHKIGVNAVRNVVFGVR